MSSLYDVQLSVKDGQTHIQTSQPQIVLIFDGILSKKRQEEIMKRLNSGESVKCSVQYLISTPA
jgi:hypothetical protein